MEGPIKHERKEWRIAGLEGTWLLTRSPTGFKQSYLWKSVGASLLVKKPLMSLPGNFLYQWHHQGISTMKGLLVTLSNIYAATATHPPRLMLPPLLPPSGCGHLRQNPSVDPHCLCQLTLWGNGSRNLNGQGRWKAIQDIRREQGNLGSHVHKPWLGNLGTTLPARENGLTTQDNARWKPGLSPCRVEGVFKSFHKLQTALPC